MNALDRAIAWLSPRRGVARARARAQIGVLRAYDGAKSGRRTDGWTAAGGSANAEIGPALAQLRNRARDLDRNNPWATRAVRVLVGNIVGTGILPTATGRGRRRAQDAFARWSEVADADGVCDYFGLQALAVRTAIVSGEALTIRVRRAPGDMPGTVPMQLRVLEPDYIDTAKTEPLAGGGWVLQGIEFDRQGRRVAYWLYDQHPGEANLVISRFNQASRRVPAEDVSHLYRIDRPGQVHGVPWLAPALMKLRDLGDYDEADLVRKKIEACVVAFVRRPEGADGQPVAPQTTDAAGHRIETFEPGMVEYLRDGEDISFNNPTATSDSGFRRDAHRAVAMGIGVTYEQISGDLSGVNYSSYRAGHLEFRTGIEEFRWLRVVPAWCNPTWRWFARDGRIAGLIGDEGVIAKWAPPKFMSVDPEKDAKADLIDMRTGARTWPQVVGERGWDPIEQLDEIARTNAEIDRRQLVLDGDPRRMARNGNPVPAAGAQNDGSAGGDDIAAGDDDQED